MGSTSLGAFLPEDRNRAGFWNISLVEKIRQWTKSKKKFESVNFSHVLFCLMSSLDHAGLGLATFGPVESKWLWHSPVRHFAF